MKSTSVRRPSVCGINYLWTDCVDFFQILVLPFPGPYAQTFSELKKNDFWIFYEYFSLSLTWDPIGAKILKRYSLPQITFESFQSFSEISSQLSTQKYCLGFLTFWVYDFSLFFFLFVNMGPCQSKNFKMLLLPQITFESFQTFSEFSSQWSLQKYCFEFF